MGLFSIVLASFLIPHHEEERSRDQVMDHRDNVDDDNEQKSRDLESNVADDGGPIQDSDPQDVDEDEPDDSPSSPTHRVTFGILSRGSSPSLEKAPANPGLLARLKSIIFPSQDEDKPLSHHRILPVVSGLVIPFSILLEIPGLTDSWYIRTDQNVVVESRPNPAGLHLMLAISMVFAVLANVSMICRFLEKGPVLATTLITMASLTIHGNAPLCVFAFDSASHSVDSVNIIAVVMFGVQHRFNDGFTYGHGYWMTGTFTAPEHFVPTLTDTL